MWGSILGRQDRERIALFSQPFAKVADGFPKLMWELNEWRVIVQPKISTKKLKIKKNIFGCVVQSGQNTWLLIKESKVQILPYPPKVESVGSSPAPLVGNPCRKLLGTAPLKIFITVLREIWDWDVALVGFFYSRK